MKTVKEMFFAKYLGQKVSYLGIIGELSFEPGEYTLHSKGHSFRDEVFLVLRSLHKLTDAELTSLSIIADKGSENELYPEQHLANGAYILRELKAGENYPLSVYDYLRAIGILLPFTYIHESGNVLTMTTEEIINLGWAKIKTL